MAASITNAVLTLLRHPEQFARLRNDPQSIALAVEELLRYDTPVQVAIRGVPKEIEFAGRWIGPRHLLVLLLGAANRDPDQFADPDRLDLTRRPQPPRLLRHWTAWVRRGLDGSLRLNDCY
jgi:pimeloyl-[acyl-carrier protein] synthase